MNLINEILGERYRIDEIIGSGGMATVYKAKDLLLDRVVAVKVLHPEFLDDEASVHKFKREARAAGSLSHFNIVGVFDVGQQGDIHYIVMELAEGRTLKEYMEERGRLSEAESIHICLQIADALSHAHDNGLIHRDIKPQNIIMNKEGRVKVADFGIARIVTTDTLTSNDPIYGSVRYISPEQANGDTVDERSDLYSLGIVFYEMLSGRLPFTGETPVEWAMKHISEEPAHIRTYLPDINPDLADIVMKTLEKDPVNRFTSIEDFTYHLRKYQQGMPVKIKKPRKSAKATPQKKSRRSSRILIVIFLVIALGAAAYMFFSWFNKYTTVAEVEVPQLVGRSLEDATKELKKFGLEVEFAPNQNHPTIEPNHVIRHTPEAGEVVKIGRAITLVLSDGVGYQVIPLIVDFPLEDAKNALVNLQFEIGKVSEEYSDEIAAGNVIDTNPKTGTEVKVGTSVDLVVSLGRDESTVTVPKVVGMTKYAAQNALTEAGLKVGKISEAKSKRPADEVIQQSVREGLKVPPDTVVDLVVSDGRQP